MITVKYIPNLLKKDGRKTKQFRYSRLKSIKNYIHEAGYDFFEAGDLKIIVSGKKITDYNKPLDNDEEIILTPDVRFEAIWVFLAGAEGGLAAFLWGAAQFIAITASIGMAIYQAVSKPRLPSFGTSNISSSADKNLDEGSPTYGWDGIQTIQEVGTPVPIIYGEHKCGGNIINNFIWTDGDKNYLNVLLALCEGEIESISSIQVNDNPIANFSGVSQYTRMGTNSQSVIDNFHDLHNIVNVNVQLLKDNSYIYTTLDDDVEGFEIHLQLPNGLFQQDENSGDINSWSVTYQVRYRVSPAGGWNDLGSTTISAKSRSTLRRIFRKEGLSPDRYDIEITKTSDNSTFYKVGDLYLQNIDEIKTNDIAYINTALLGLKLLATDQLSGSMPNITPIVKGKKIKVPDIKYSGSPVAWEDYYWDPGASQWKRFSDDAVCTWDGNTYIDAYCANPSWVLYDLLINSRYGLGEYISESQLDLSLFLEMAKYCDEKLDDGASGYEKRITLNVVIDSSTRALDLIAQLCASFRGLPFYSAGAIRLTIDKTDTPVQLFGMGNIIDGSFKQNWKSIKDVPNVVEIQYLDKDKEYRQETIAVVDETSLNNGDPMRKKLMRLFVTKQSEAIRGGRHALWAEKYINRSIQFSAGIDGVAVQAGDLINLSHDVPQWGWSGRVVSGTISSITLDQEVTIEAGKTYKVRVRYSDDTVDERTITDGSGTYTTLNVSVNFSQTPQGYDKYAFGEDTKVVKPFRILSMKRGNNNEVSISAIEYDANVYDDSAVVLPTNSYSALSLSIPPVIDLTLTERLVKLKDGTLDNIIDVWFQKPTMDNYFKRYVKARIYLSDDNGVSWDYRGETTTEEFAIQGGIKDTNTYKVAVVSISEKDEESAITNSPQDTIQVLGKTAPPGDVPLLEVSQTNDRLYFKITPVSDVDISKYKIKRGPSWAEGVLVADLIDVTEWSTVVGYIGSTTFWVKAIDTSGNESQNATKDIINIVMPPEKNVIEEMDLWSKNLEYKHNATDIEWTNDYDKKFVRKSICIPTATKWEDLDGTGTFESKDGTEFDRPLLSADQYFSMEIPHDLGMIFEFEVFVDMDLFSWSIGVEINYSEDNVIWSGWETVLSGTTYKARYVRFRFVFNASDVNVRTRMVDLIIMYNAPALLREYGRDVLIPTSGKTINLSENYIYPPRVIVQVLGGGGAMFADVYNKSTTSFDTKVYDNNNNPVQKEVDWDTAGF